MMCLYGICDSDDSSYWNLLIFGVKCLVHVHVRHDLIAHLNGVVSALFGRYLDETQIRFGIDKPGIDSHSGDIDHTRIVRNFYRSRRPDGSDFAVRDHQHSVADGAVGYGEQLAAREHDWLILSHG